MRRPHAWFLLRFLPSAVLCTGSGSGCAVLSNTTSPIAPYALDISPPLTGVATGVTATVRINLRMTSNEDWGGWGAGPQLPTVSVDHLGCSPDCGATATDVSSIEVSATTAGLRKVDFVLSTSDGQHRPETANIDFRDPSRIDARRGQFSPSGIAFAMVPGDGQWWDVRVADETGPLLVERCKPDVTATGAIAVDTTRCDGPVGLDAVAPGAGIVTMRYGNVVRTVTVNVIDPASIEHVELRQVIAPSDAGIPIESADGLVAPVVSPLVIVTACSGYGSLLVVPELTTADGTVAYGAANLLRASPSGRSVLLETYGQVVDLSLQAATGGTLRGDFGNRTTTTLSMPFMVQSDTACAP
jgi:hypothetical protein